MEPEGSAEKTEMTYLCIIRKLKPTSSSFLSSIVSPVLPIMKYGNLTSDTEEGRKSLALIKEKLLMKI